VSRPVKEDGATGPGGALLDAIAGWLAPSRRKRRVIVPELRGRNVSDTWFVAAQADVRLRIVRLQLRPAAADGYVVGRDPPAGARVRPGSTVTLIVQHPDAESPGDDRES
jgi:beta-lactam-binding protein with PASTA domain